MSQNAVSQAADDVRKLALYNPKLAFMLTRGQPLQQRIYTVDIEFDAVAANQTLRNNQLDDKMFQMFWVQYMLYTIRRPLYNVGVFGAREQDEYCKLNPYVDIDFRLVGRERYSLTEGMTPLENVASPSSAPNPKALDWILTEDSNVSIDATNTRTFAETEVPYQVRLTLVGKELSGCELPNCGYDSVICQLRNEGFYPMPSEAAMEPPRVGVQATDPRRAVSQGGARPQFQQTDLSGHQRVK